MAYSTLADITLQLDEDTLVQLTDDSDAGTVDETIVAKATEDADSEIDTHIGRKYTVPVSPVPAAVRKWSVDIAIYNLYARREGPPDWRTERYNSAVRSLERIADGRAVLGAGNPDGNPPESNFPDMSSQTRIFTREGMDGF